MTCYFGTKFDATECTSTYLDLNVTSMNRIIHLFGLAYIITLFLTCNSEHSLLVLMYYSYIFIFHSPVSTLSYLQLLISISLLYMRSKSTKCQCLTNRTITNSPSMFL